MSDDSKLLLSSADFAAISQAIRLLKLIHASHIPANSEFALDEIISALHSVKNKISKANTINDKCEKYVR